MLEPLINQPKLLALKPEFEELGTVMLPQSQSPITASEWARLDNLTSPQMISYEFVARGDVDEPHSVNVARFMNDVERPELVPGPVPRALLDILGTRKMMQFFCQLLGQERLFIRRCQAHILGKNDFIGLHLDQKSNPDYLAPVVMVFQGSEQGGDYIVHHPERGCQVFSAAAGSIIVSHCNLPHEVTPVLEGRRKSLVFFLSAEDGVNRRLQS